MKKIFFPAYLILVLPACALAGLGGAVDSYPNQPPQTTTSRQVVTAASSKASIAYSIQQLRDDAGNLITEYVTSNGVVFAVTWQGPFKPDLHQLLGSYFKTYLSVEDASSGRQPQVVQQSQLVVVSEGRLRNFHGKAYLPDLVPSDFSLDGLN